ncbi:unnamed protein product, partial [Laminaria digitata]
MATCIFYHCSYTCRAVFFLPRLSRPRVDSAQSRTAQPCYPLEPPCPGHLAQQSAPLDYERGSPPCSNKPSFSFLSAWSCFCWLCVGGLVWSERHFSCVPSY